MSLVHQTLAQLSTAFKAGEITSRKITEAFIKEIESRDKEVNAFVTTTFDLAREMANAADSRYQNGTLLSDLDGMPMTLKDVVCTAGVRTTASSNMLKDFVPPYNATVWQKLKDAGVVLLGKVNTDEFTMGVSTETSVFGVTKNPHDITKVSGGSSGGSAAAVAANFCTASIGTDTGGSIRQPAHFCGCTGLKVSYGRVSRWGTMPMASSLDSVGCLAKTTQDCALILEIIAGQDPKDSTTPPITVPKYTERLDQPLKGAKIGIPKEYFIAGIDDEIVAVVDSTKALLENLGAKVMEVSLPHTKYGIAAYYIIAPSEISANLSRFDGIRYGLSVQGTTLEEIYTKTRQQGFGDEVKRRILIGTYALSAGYYEAYYRKAQKVRTLVKQDFANAFAEVDALLAPVFPSTAFSVGRESDPLRDYIEDALTISANLAGICGISVPVGKSKTGLPIGVQFLCPAFAEERALNIAHQIEQSLS